MELVRPAVSLRPGPLSASTASASDPRSMSSSSAVPDANAARRGRGLRRNAVRSWVPGSLAVLAIWLVFVVSPMGRAVDLVAFAGRLDAGRQLHLINTGLLNAITATSAGSGLLGLAVIGAWRHRLPAAVRAGCAVVAAAVSAELLKLALPHVGVTDHAWTWTGGGSFPSGHTTIAASMSLALLTVSSGEWRRRLVGPLLAWTVLTATATITMGWHRPSDVLGALATAALWHSAGQRGRHARMRTRKTGAWLAAVARHRAWSTPALWWAVATAVVLWGSSPSQTEAWAEKPTAVYLVALSAVALSAVVLFVGARQTSATRPV